MKKYILFAVMTALFPSMAEAQLKVDQNESIGGTKIYQANTIKVGTNVTNTKPIGSVVFNGNKTILIGNEIEINGETTVELGTELEIHTE